MSFRSLLVQGTLLAILTLLLAFIFRDLVSSRRPAGPEAPVDLPPERGTVFVADVSPGAQLLLKSFYDYEPGDVANDRVLGERLGGSEFPRAFLSLVAMNFSREQPLAIALPRGSIRLRLRDGRTLEHSNLAPLEGAEKTTARSLWSTAFGAPEGGVSIAPRTLRRFIVAFPGPLKASEIEGATFRSGDAEIGFVRRELPKSDLYAFLESPRDPLEADSAPAGDRR